MNHFSEVKRYCDVTTKADLPLHIQYLYYLFDSVLFLNVYLSFIFRYVH